MLYSVIREQALWTISLALAWWLSTCGVAGVREFKFLSPGSSHLKLFVVAEDCDTGQHRDSRLPEETAAHWVWILEPDTLWLLTKLFQFTQREVLATSLVFSSDAEWRHSHLVVLGERSLKLVTVYFTRLSHIWMDFTWEQQKSTQHCNISTKEAMKMITSNAHTHTCTHTHTRVHTHTHRPVIFWKW